MEKIYILDFFDKKDITAFMHSSDNQRSSNRRHSSSFTRSSVSFSRERFKAFEYSTD